MYYFQPALEFIYVKKEKWVISEVWAGILEPTEVYGLTKILHSYTLEVMA